MSLRSRRSAWVKAMAPTGQCAAHSPWPMHLDPWTTAAWPCKMSSTPVSGQARMQLAQPMQRLMSTQGCSNLALWEPLCLASLRWRRPCRSSSLLARHAMHAGMTVASRRTTARKASGGRDGKEMPGCKKLLRKSAKAVCCPSPIYGISLCFIFRHRFSLPITK